MALTFRHRTFFYWFVCRNAYSVLIATSCIFIYTVLLLQPFLTSDTIRRQTKNQRTTHRIGLRFAGICYCPLAFSGWNSFWLDFLLDFSSSRRIIIIFSRNKSWGTFALDRKKIHRNANYFLRIFIVSRTYLLSNELLCFIASRSSFKNSGG